MDCYVTTIGIYWVGVGPVGVCTLQKKGVRNAP